MDRYISPKYFSFLRDLADNNEREWFKANKGRYESDVKDAALEFINGFAPYLAKISKHFVADSRPVGGSMFRIHRDTRFSKDKTPYKTYTGIQFRHEMAKDVHAPGFYLHLQPGACYAGFGLWRPETSVAYQIRDAILENPAGWKKAAHSKAFRSQFSLDGESLKRPPKGVDADHPLVEDLKRKDFIAGGKLTQKQVTAPGFESDYAAVCKAASPYMRFLCKAIGVPF